MSVLFHESSLTKVAALFGRAMDARAAAERLIQHGRFPERQVKVVGPGDAMLDRKLEPEADGIFGTMIKAHAVLGIAGLFVGLLFAGVLLLSGVSFAVASPYSTAIVAGFFGLVGGLLLGGLVTLRPDHDVLIAEVGDAVREGHWAVVAHPRNRNQERHAVDVLAHSGGKVVQTL